jgi:hypothetical protein
MARDANDGNQLGDGLKYGSSCTYGEGTSFVLDPK